MPRLRPAPVKPEVEKPEIEAYVAPEGDIEIELPGDEIGPAEVELAPKVEPKTETPVEDNALAKALEAQSRAEELARTNARERDEALRRAHEREQELETERGRGDDAEYGQVLTSIAAEESSLAKAEADYAAFAQAGDWAQAAAAQRIMATASSRLDRLGENKIAFDSKREQTKTAPPVQRAAPAAQGFEQRLATMPVPDNAKVWLRSHPELIEDTAKTRALGSIHNYLIDIERIEPFTPAYFDALDTRLGFKKASAPEPEPHVQPQPPRRSMPVSAPVSRDVPTSSGQRAPSSKIILTEEERRVARTSFTDPTGKMTDADKEYLYAQNKRKLQAMRANGSYRQTTEQNG